MFHKDYKELGARKKIGQQCLNPQSKSLVALRLDHGASSYEVDHINQLSEQLNLPIVKDDESAADFLFFLMYSNERLSLKDLSQPKIKPICVDFVHGKVDHRRRFGGGQGQMIAKAVGVSGRFHPHVLDTTAGLGGDGFVLACLNCQLTLLERNPIVHALLNDGLERARHCDQTDIQAIIENMQLLPIDAIEHLQALKSHPGQHATSGYDVIYIDPMFPERKKSAAVKKEMQFFHQLVGADSDQAQLLSSAIKAAKYRAVVKRPRLAETIGGISPSYQLMGKTSRYDIYVNQKIP